MAHHAVPALIHTRAPRPSSAATVATRNRFQYIPTETRIYTDSEGLPKSVKLSQRSLWCCFFLIMPFAIPVLIYVKDNDVSRRIFLGFFTAIVIATLVCISLAVFHSRTREAMMNRRIGDDDDRPGFPTHYNDEDSATPTTTANTQEQMLMLRSLTGTPIHYAFVLAPQLSQISVSPAQHRSSFPPTIQIDDPPPYHVALDLPLPEVHSSSLRETMETPPPDYDKVEWPAV